MPWCDSSVTLNLTINIIDLSTDVQGATITSNASNVTYQWLDCDNSMNILTGETSQSFTPTTNGNYAVEVGEAGWVDTSDCVLIAGVSLVENSFADIFEVHPNPTKGDFTLMFKHAQEDLTVRLISLTGRLLESKHFSNVTSIPFQITQPAGIYMLEVTDNNGNKAVLRVIKE